MTSTLPADLRLVDVPEDRYEEWLDRFLGAFGYMPEGDEVEFFRAMYPHVRAIAVTDQTGYIATAAARDLDLVLPGGETVGMAGVTGMTVDPTATRQGVLRAMMAHLHRRAVDEGRPVAGLAASEWPIYGRFGYGIATWFDALRIEVPAAGWCDDALGRDLLPRRISGNGARELAQALHTRQAIATPGEVLPPVQYWDRFIIDDPSSRRLDVLLGLASNDAGRRRCVAVADRGLVSYRITSEWTPNATPNDTLQVTDLLAADAEAAKALWRHLLSVDLVTQIQVPRVAVDDPLHWWVADSRRLQPRRRDGLWLRPLDVARLLEAREWSGQGALTLALHDREGYADGTFRLEVDAGRGSCERISAEAEMEMDVAALGAILLGGTTATSLARSGLIHAADPRGAQLWDTLATPERAPFLSWAV